MNHPFNTPEERYATVVEVLLSSSNATQSSDAAQSKQRFGTTGLRINDKIFAMLVKDRLVVKLPRQRVDALIAAGEGERFDPGHGRLMKEWVAVDTTAEVGWLPLAREAMEFVAAKR
jgi:hypothetical protein